MQNKELKKAASLLGKLGGAAKSIKKAKSSRKNGKLGGRPRKVIEKISPCVAVVSDVDYFNGVVTYSFEKPNKKLALPQEAHASDSTQKATPKLVRGVGIKKEKE